MAILSAEKEIVNYWYNKKGLFTINNIKSSNRDCGILALKFEKDKIEEVFHVEVSCSITNNISETTNLGKSVSSIIEDKFENKNVAEAIDVQTRQLSIQKSKIKKIIILGAMPKSRKSEIIGAFREKDVEAIELENILYDVLENLGTQYYRNDIIRTLQLTKFLLLGEPTKLAKMLVNDNISSNSRKEFLSNILGNDDVIKEFRKTNAERLSIILKNSSLKPTELAAMLGSSILNNKTRKLFLSSFMEQESTRKIINRQKKAKKSNVSLGKFF